MTTTSPGQFDALAAVAELHAAVRKWTEHIPQNLPYVDLMFAFGFATLGDRSRAESLVEAARKVMQVPIPPIPSRYLGDKEFVAVVAPVVSNFLFKAFKYRVDQALAGKPHAGPLSDVLLTVLDGIANAGRDGVTNNAYKVSQYVITRLRSYSTILEPEERPDVYNLLFSPDPFRKQLADIVALRNMTELATGIRQLLRDGGPGRTAFEVRFWVLYEALPIARRVGEAFAVDLLEMIPEVLAATPHYTPGREPHDQPRSQGEVLARGLVVAARVEREEQIRTLMNAFVRLVRGKHGELPFGLINAVAGPGLRALKKPGMHDEIERFLTLVQTDVLGGATVAELQARHGSKPDMLSAVFQTLLHVATGRLMLKQHDRAIPVLTEIREALLSLAAPPFDSKDYTPLARAYVAAASYETPEQGLARIIELFREMNPKRITNTWTTKEHFSRFHLNIVEDTVLAVCRMDFAAPHVVSAGSP
jgi:hypothetical protein